jgi:hypothetical protein
MLAVQNPPPRRLGVMSSFQQYYYSEDETLSRVVEPPGAGVGIAELAALQLIESDYNVIYDSSAYDLNLMVGICICLDMTETRYIGMC